MGWRQRSTNEFGLTRSSCSTPFFISTDVWFAVSWYTYQKFAFKMTILWHELHFIRFHKAKAAATIRVPPTSGSKHACDA